MRRYHLPMSWAMNFTIVNDATYCRSCILNALASGSLSIRTQALTYIKVYELHIYSPTSLQGLETPKIETEPRRIPKSELEWTTNEERLTNSNSKASYAIFCAINQQEFKRISKCIVAKKAWGILQTALEEPT
ncbi:hypothetical protein Gogos_016994 [Gossypium gossypioides]|uniref:Uncharacterized protein n=1 Tax=Gossypium gossypioides TaxID=34282 RepID=A0A7J9B9D3_GOSGO|nr:hypothetical protein [Gossypium gossypioides]